MKGISAILATVLIVVITIAIVGLMYGWATGLFGTVTETSEDETGAVVGAMQKQVQILAVACNLNATDDGNTITYTLKASGTGDVNQTEITVFLNNVLVTDNGLGTDKILSGTSDEFSFTTLIEEDGIEFKINAPAGSVKKDIDCPEIP